MAAATILQRRHGDDDGGTKKERKRETRRAENGIKKFPRRPRKCATKKRRFFLKKRRGGGGGGFLAVGDSSMPEDKEAYSEAAAEISHDKTLLESTAVKPTCVHTYACLSFYAHCLSSRVATESGSMRLFSLVALQLE